MKITIDKKRWRGFVSGFVLTLLMLAIAGTLMLCEAGVQKAGYTPNESLLKVDVADKDKLELWLLGTGYDVDMSIPAEVENIRRKYYTLLPRGARVVEQAVWYTMSEIFTLLQNPKP